jgi:hypothetical protein
VLGDQSHRAFEHDHEGERMQVREASRAFAPQSGGSMSSRRAFLAALGAVAGAVALPGLQAEVEASAGQFGSGGLDPWPGLLKAITPDSKIRAVLAADGVFAFGDSIARQDSVPLVWEVYNSLGLLMAVNNWRAADRSGRGRPGGVGGNLRAAVAGPHCDRRVVWVNVHVSRWRYSTSVQVADQRNSGWINVQLALSGSRTPEPGGRRLGQAAGRLPLLSHPQVPVRRCPHLSASRSGSPQRDDRGGPGMRTAAVRRVSGWL